MGESAFDGVVLDQKSVAGAIDQYDEEALWVVFRQPKSAGGSVDGLRTRELDGFPEDARVIGQALIHRIGDEVDVSDADQITKVDLSPSGPHEIGR
jgi:formamidopyrimidine-DNA glycosylase